MQLPTPKTPRHREACAKKVPITPRHRIGLVGKSLTPRGLRTPSTPKNVSSLYISARQLFTRSALPGRLVGRDDEKKHLQSLLHGALASRSGRCIYVSGPPGTGKSALIREVCNGIQGMDGVKALHINCMGVKTPEEIYARLSSELIADQLLSGPDTCAQLQSIFVAKKNLGGFMYVVTLDEIDQLVPLDLKILYTLFEWSLHQSSRLVIIGIANALDLTDRFLPRLRARNLKPHLVPFLPYTASQIVSIVTTKLRSLSFDDKHNQPNFVPFVHPAAIQLCSKKVASQTGDLRKAFDLIRRTIDLVEAETMATLEAELISRSAHHSPIKSPLCENPNLASPSPCRVQDVAASFAKLTPLTAPRATIAHVSRVSAAALSNGTAQRLHSLNLQQKAALCALLSHQKTSRKAVNFSQTLTKASSVAPTVKGLHEIYRSLCKQGNAMQPLTRMEFADLISGLETLGLVGSEDGNRVFMKKITPRKKRRDDERKIVSFVDEKDIRSCLHCAGSGILGDLVVSSHDE